ncbi:MAG: hypothetical protein MR051_07035 [Lentisphaeria bacterium]|nr:hypothetical protein [Lentisphaeria bacterium]
MASPVTLAVIGADARGTGYSRFANEHPDRLRIIAVAEPDNLATDFPNGTPAASKPVKTRIGSFSPVLVAPSFAVISGWIFRPKNVTPAW